MNEAGVIKMGATRSEMAKEITDDIKLKAACIAIGNGGSSVGVRLSKEGYKVVFINTSFKDLDTTLIPDTQDAYLIEDARALSRGAGRDRSTAKEIYKSWTTKSGIFKSDTFDTMVREHDIIFVLSSTAGGTGSGLTPTLCYQLSKRYPTKIVIPVAILPRDTESIKSQLNTVEFINELENINKTGDVSLSYMIYDLNKLSHMSQADSYTAIADTIAEDIGILTGELAETTKHGMIDERDALTIMSAPGLMTVVSERKVDLSKVDNTGIEKMMLNKIKSSATCNPQKDKICQYFGIYLKVQGETEDAISKNDYTELSTAVGKPLDIFINYATTEGSFSSYGLIISGQSMPFDRVNRCAEIVKDYQNGRKSKAYDLQSEVSSMKELTANKQHDKLMGSASKAVTDDSDTLPDFLM